MERGGHKINNPVILEETFSYRVFNTEFIIGLILILPIILFTYFITPAENPNYDIIIALVAILLLYPLYLLLRINQKKVYKFYSDHFEIIKSGWAWPYSYYVFYDDIQQIKNINISPYRILVDRKFKYFIRNRYSTWLNYKIFMITLKKDGRINYRGKIIKGKEIPNGLLRGRDIYYRFVTIPRDIFNGDQEVLNLLSKYI